MNSSREAQGFDVPRRSFDLRRGLQSSMYYSEVRSFKAPLVPLALPFRPTSGIRFLARDPFDDSKSAKVFYEEFFGSGDDTEMGLLPLADINVMSREYVRGGPKSKSTPFIPGGEAWSEVEKSEDVKNILEDARSLKWLKEYESGSPPDVPIPGFEEYLLTLESDKTQDAVQPDVV